MLEQAQSELFSSSFIGKASGEDDNDDDEGERRDLSSIFRSNTLD